MDIGAGRRGAGDAHGHRPDHTLRDSLSGAPHRPRRRRDARCGVHGKRHLDLQELASNRICLANISAGPIVIEGDFRVSRFGWWCGSGYIQAWSGTDRLYALQLRNSSVQYYDGVHRNFSADTRAETGTWYHIKVVLDTLNATRSAWMDGRYLGSAPLRFADGSPVPPGTVFTDVALIGSSAWERGAPHHFYLDNIVVRNYVPVEPVLSYMRCCEERG